MEESVRNYRKQVLRELRCGILTKIRLREKLTASLKYFAYENPKPTDWELEDAFGPPEEMAATLMYGVSKKEQQRCLQVRQMMQVGVAVLMAVILVFAMYTFFLKQNPVYIVDGLHVEGTLTPVVEMTHAS